MSNAFALAEEYLTSRTGRDYSGFTFGAVSGSARSLLAGGRTAFNGGAPVTADSQFDIASLTKVMVAIAATRYIAAGEIDPDAPIGPVLPELPADAASLSVRELATHCSGLGSSEFFPELSGLSDPERWDAFYGRTRVGEGRGRFDYSCLNYILLGRVLERVTGKRLDEIIRADVWGPLEMTDTSFGAIDPHLTVATEVDAVLGRGLVQGQVHDELAWLLGRPVGNAGVFATGEDLLRVVEHLQDLGQQPGPGADLLFTDQSPTSALVPFGHSFGLRIDDPEFMGTWGGYGHTGFTGCALYIAPDFARAYVLALNSVHPHRGRVDPFIARRRLTDLLHLG